MLSARVDGDSGGVAEGVRRYTLRTVGVNLVRACVVLLALPVALFALPLAFVVVVVGSYLTYGLPFVVVTHDARAGEALVAVPAVYVAAYGLLVFRGLGGERTTRSGRLADTTPR